MASRARRVAVTGASGRCAAGLLDRLECQQSIERVLAIDIRPPAAQRGPKVLFHRHDVSQPLGGLMADHAIDTIVHLAFAMSAGHNRAASLRVNIGGMESVLEAVEQAGVRHILYLSSTTVYGAHSDNPPLLTEESPLRPLKGFRYSEDKVRAERMLRETTDRRPGVTASVLRACPVVGRGSPGPMGQALAKPIGISIRGHDPPMQLLHEDDLSEVMVRCILDRVSGLYNLAGAGGVRWSDMVRSSGRRRVSLPAPVLYTLTGAAWHLRLQTDSPACGLDLIRYPWNVSTQKIRHGLGIELRYSSTEAWNTYASEVSAASCRHRMRTDG